MHENNLIILAGGLAKRIRPISLETPKLLIKLNGKPFAFYLFKKLEKYNFNKIIICVNHLKEEIFSFFKKNNFELNIHFISDNSKYPGTCGAIFNAQKKFNLLGSLVMYGDTYLTTDFQNIFKKIKNKNKSILFINKNSNQYDKSNVYFDKIKKKFIYDSKLNKNINYNYIDYGLSYVFNDELDIMMQDKKIIDMKYFFDFSSKKDTLEFVEINNLFYEIGSFKGITRFQNEKPYKNFL